MYDPSHVIDSKVDDIFNFSVGLGQRIIIYIDVHPNIISDYDTIHVDPNTDDEVEIFNVYPNTV